MYSIKDLEALSGIKAHTIRIWEQRYHFLKPQRSSGNIRHYCCGELTSLLNIALLNKYGFKVSVIDKMGREEIEEKIQSLTDPKAIEERRVNELIHQMAELEAGKFEALIDNYIDEKGIESAITELLLPFLIKTGLLWQSGKINPAQEVLVSNILRQKIIVALETNITPVKNSGSFLFFLPEGEHHELGLIFIYYLLKARGIEGLYLGANMPIQDVERVIKNKKPEFIFIHFTSDRTKINMEKFLNEVGKRFKDVQTIISGNLIEKYSKKPSAGMHFKRSISELLDWTSQL